MDNLGIKATIYDILGYIIPGVIALISTFMLLYEKDIEWLISLKAVKYSSPFYILFFILAYVSGQIISSFSSFIFEGKLTIKIFNKLFPKKSSEHDTRTTQIFNKNYNDCDKQIIISYCQEKFPKIYDTAFVFLTIYGLSRNISVSFLIIGLYVIKIYGFVSFENILIIGFIVLLVRNYLRFKKYFTKKINSALYL